MINTKSRFLFNWSSRGLMLLFKSVMTWTRDSELDTQGPRLTSKSKSVLGILTTLNKLSQTSG